MMEQGNPMDLTPGIRVNFRLGINADGAPFAGYHGVGKQLIFVKAQADPGRAIRTNEWTHLAATYQYQSATNHGMLILYINGQAVATEISDEVPCTGFWGVNNIYATSAPLVIGASDGNPQGTVPAHGPDTRPEPVNFFRGWIDEVRIWDGARSQNEIAYTMKKALSRGLGVRAYIDDDPSLINDHPVLMSRYGFDDVPDPQHSGIVPHGFEATMSAIQPADWSSIAWLSGDAERSMVYRDYQYVVWCADTLEHFPVVPPEDIGDPAVIDTNGVCLFPNPSDPYSETYATAIDISGEYINSDTDVLPLRWVEADADIPMWDDGTVPAHNLHDTDGDGLPDWWEEQYGLNPLNPDGIYGGDADIDGDGLTNYQEYQAGTDPRMIDTDGDGIDDKAEDGDHDGLSNYDEINIYGSNPGDPDTDDDGVIDGDEIDQSIVKADGRVITSPIYSSSPIVQRSLWLDGTAVEIPKQANAAEEDRFDVAQWTLECWFMPTNGPQTGSIIKRSTYTGQTTFDLRLDNNIPGITFTTAGGQRVSVDASAPISDGVWTHLAGVWDPENDTLYLIVNGTKYQAQISLGECARGNGETVIGDGIQGWIDDIRIWRLTRSVDQIMANSTLFGSFFIDIEGVEQYVSEVIGSNLGDATINGNNHADPADVIGEPDFSGVASNVTGFVSLGISDAVTFYEELNNAWLYDGQTITRFPWEEYSGVTNVAFNNGYIQMAFGDGNYIVASGDARPDFVVHEVASEDDPFYVFVSTDGDSWMYVGHSEGDTTAFDLDYAPLNPVHLDVLLVGTDGGIRYNYWFEREEPRESPNENLSGFKYIMILDGGRNEGLSTIGMPGADIDSVVSILYPAEYAPIAWYPFNDGGVTAEDYMHRNDWDYAFDASAATSHCRFDTNQYADLVGVVDLDTDDIADWWEKLFFGGNALPLDDSDGDGLNNLDEYIQGTNPHALDSDGDGIPDSYNDLNGNGMADSWETLFGLPSMSSVAAGAYGDPDHDGLINLYEYLAWKEYGLALNPTVFNTFQTNVVSDFYLVPSGGGGLTLGEIYDDTDVLPDLWEANYPMVMDRHYYHGDQDPDHDEWNNREEYLAGTDPTSVTSAPIPSVSGIIQYNGSIVAAANSFRIFAYDSADMNTVPVEGVVSSSDGVFTFAVSNVSSRTVWLFAYKSGNGGGDAGSAIGFVPGDAYGVAGPIPVSFSGVDDVVVPVLDQEEMPWYQAFSWPDQPGLADVFVRIRAEDDGDKRIMTRWVHTDRNFFQAVDYQRGDPVPGSPAPAEGYPFGLPPGNYKWQVSSNDMNDARYKFAEGTFNVPLVDPPIPEVVSPMGGDIIVHQLHNFSWKADPQLPMPRFDIQIAPSDNSWTYETNISVQASDLAGTHTVRMPIQRGGVDLFGNGRWVSGEYNWRVRSGNNESYSSWSSWRRFQLAVTNAPTEASGAPQISGRVIYHGKADTDNIVVRAIKIPGYDNRVEGQVTLSASGPFNLDFTMRGLRHVTYRMMAFIDLDKDGICDEWEPQGLARDSSFGEHYEYRTDAYGLGRFALDAANQIENVSILIRDRDTDNDNVMDGWEWLHMHNSPRGMTYTGDDDMDGDGLSNLQEYGLDTDPTDADSDGDGIADGEEINTYGTSPTNSDSDGDSLPDGEEANTPGLSPTSADDDGDGVPTRIEVAWDNQAGSISSSDMNPLSPDSDGDGIDDLMEIASGSDPLNPADTAVIAIGSLSRTLDSLSWKVGLNKLSVDVTYIIEYSADMVEWKEVGEVTDDGDNFETMRYSGLSTPAKGGYYRLRLQIR
jgi:hypothetical protein